MQEVNPFVPWGAGLGTRKALNHHVHVTERGCPHKARNEHGDQSLEAEVHPPPQDGASGEVWEPPSVCGPVWGLREVLGVQKAAV